MPSVQAIKRSQTIFFSSRPPHGDPRRQAALSQDESNEHPCLQVQWHSLPSYRSLNQTILFLIFAQCHHFCYHITGGHASAKYPENTWQKWTRTLLIAVHDYLIPRTLQCRFQRTQQHRHLLFKPTPGERDPSRIHYLSRFIRKATGALLVVLSKNAFCPLKMTIKSKIVGSLRV